MMNMHYEMNQYKFRFSSRFIEFNVKNLDKHKNKTNDIASMEMFFRHYLYPNKVYRILITMIYLSNGQIFINLF
jgi:hypothetical protein